MRGVIRLAVIGLAAATLLVAGTSLASANGGGATVVKDIPCGIALPGMTPNAVFTTGHLVVTPSGNASLICHAEIPEGPPRAVIIRDLPCFLGPVGVTGESHTVITPSGRVTLTCHLNGSS